MSPDAEPLLLAISQAFPPTPIPSPDTIVSDSSGAHLECTKTRAVLGGRAWDAIPFEVLQRLRSALAFLSAEGFRYYLPAFIFLAITDYDRADVIPLETVLALTAPRAGDVETMRARFAGHPERIPLDASAWESLLSEREQAWRTGADERAFLSRVGGFTPEQRRAIRSYLEYLIHAHGEDFAREQPQVALDRYWNMF